MTVPFSDPDETPLPAAGRRRRSRLRGALIALAAVVVAGAGTAAAVGFGGRDAGTAAASGLPPATAPITRQTLADEQSEDGELGYGTTRTASARSNGTITALAGTGATIKRGQSLYAVDNAKVVLLYGRLPAYRVLGPGAEGADVEQFERNLKALGYSGFTVDDDYSESTAEAVREWQEDLGLPETGRVEPSRIVYADGEVRVDGHEAEVGDPAQPGQAVLTFTGTSRLVTVELDVDDQRLAKKDAKVAVTLPDGKEVEGKITKVETVIQTPSGAGNDEPETKIEVSVSLADPKALTGFDSASVKVAFTASERADVLTVPVAALLALAEGGYGVELVEGSTTRVVAVRTGLFANGRVEISGDAVAEGMTVGVPK
ncbi:peptidoglycan-binding protein [Micromonospora sp. NPDC049559]|uniref:peptidoglycan-binding protein n=1 Tax=Micromonospora sp. NPDC049559 TaxID=3155923 RepID=UPI00341ECD8F